MDDVAHGEAIHNQVLEYYRGDNQGVTKMGDVDGLKGSMGLLSLFAVALAGVSGIWLQSTVTAVSTVLMKWAFTY